MKRRLFLQSTALAASAMAIHPLQALVHKAAELKVACQHYTWFSYFRREGKAWEEDLQASFDAVRKAGLTGYEPSFKDVKHVNALAPEMTLKGVWTKSMYVNSLLHEETKQKASMDAVLKIAAAAKKIGVEIIVTNPSPIQWGQPIDKNDRQLRTQAKALDNLGEALRKMGMKLAYHNHDMEMRQSAREFHHMMLATEPENVYLCLDAHWVYRGAGDSQVALFDIVKLYADRIVELHLRQSNAGIWSEVFGKGDVDYERLAEELLRKDLKPHLVLEQAVEEGTPHKLNSIEAIAKSLENVKETFKAFG